VCVCVVSLYACVCVCVGVVFALLPWTASSATEPFAALRISSLRAKLPSLFDGTCLGHTASARANCRQPHASAKSVKRIDRRFTVYSPHPPRRFTVYSTLLSKVCPGLRCRCEVYSSSCALWSSCPHALLQCIPWRSALGLAPAPCSVLPTPVGARSPFIVCPGLSPCRCAVTVPRLRAFTPSCNASLAFRAWPCTSVTRTPGGAQSQE
jgi:hypothetical protein